MESTSKPKGIIQKPRMGKKPNSPPTQSARPTTMRSGREDGIGIEKRPK
jgi:hypothetical protein